MTNEQVLSEIKVSLGKIETMLQAIDERGRSNEGKIRALELSQDHRLGERIDDLETRVARVEKKLVFAAGAGTGLGGLAGFLSQFIG